MANEKGNIEAYLALTLHHVAPHKARLMSALGFLDPDELAYRFKLVTDNLEPVVEKIKEIRAAAERGDCKAVLKALDAEVEFGHDFVTK